MKVRRFRSEDATEVARLHRGTIRHVNSKHYPAKVIDIWSGRVSAKMHRYALEHGKKWVAIIDKKIVGYTDHGDDGSFWGLYVHKDFLGRGVGTKLMKTAEASLKKMGIKKVEIQASITAVPFYKKMGYKRIKPGKHKMGKVYVDYILMRKAL